MEEEIKIIEENIDYNSLLLGYGDAELSEKLINAINCLIQAYKEDEAVIDKMAGYIDLVADEYISKMLNKGDVAYYGSRYCIKRFFRNKVKRGG